MPYGNQGYYPNQQPQHGLLSRVIGGGYGNELEGGNVQTMPDGSATSTPY